MNIQTITTALLATATLAFLIAIIILLLAYKGSEDFVNKYTKTIKLIRGMAIFNFVFSILIILWIGVYTIHKY